MWIAQIVKIGTAFFFFFFNSLSLRNKIVVSKTKKLVIVKLLTYLHEALFMNLLAVDFLIGREVQWLANGDAFLKTF